MHIATIQLERGISNTFWWNLYHQEIEIHPGFCLKQGEMKQTVFNRPHLPVLDQVEFPAAAIKGSMHIIYEGKKGRSIYPLNLPKKIHKQASILQTVHLDSSQSSLCVKARNGDWLYNLSYQEKSSAMMLYPGLDLIIDVFDEQGNRVDQLTNYEVNPKTYVLIILNR
ncbi:MAG: hypothetical protein H0Z32_03355 [Bacillaceae bacterium]|nr:hypothetical protein [Bacillaceae bacterium]